MTRIDTMPVYNFFQSLKLAMWCSEEPADYRETKEAIAKKQQELHNLCNCSEQGKSSPACSVEFLLCLSCLADVLKESGTTLSQQATQCCMSIWKVSCRKGSDESAHGCSRSQ